MTITTIDHATGWIVTLHDFGRIYQQWLNEITSPSPGKTGPWVYTPWRLYLKTEALEDSLQIARGQQRGMRALAKAQVLTHNENLADHETRRPDIFDNAIE